MASSKKFRTKGAEMQHMHEVDDIYLRNHSNNGHNNESIIIGAARGQSAQGEGERV